MEENNNEELWVWVIVQDPDGKEQFLGQYDDENKISFIPVFPDKEQAEQGMVGLSKEQNLKYQAQAILYEDIAERASKNGFQIYLLGGDGRIIQKVAP